MQRWFPTNKFILLALIRKVSFVEDFDFLQKDHVAKAEDRQQMGLTF